MCVVASVDLHLHTDSNTAVNAAFIARCTNCFAYINPFVTFSRRSWKCTVCHGNNDLSGERYANLTAQQRDQMPEFRQPLIEYSMDDPDAEDDFDHTPTAQTPQTATADHKDSKHTPNTTAGGSGGSTTGGGGSGGGSESEAPSNEYPAYIFCVDISGRTEYIELVKSSILAAVEALSPQAWVGLAVFSSKIGLYDLRSAVPHVKYIRIPPTPPQTIACQYFSPLITCRVAPTPAPT